MPWGWWWVLGAHGSRYRRLSLELDCMNRWLGSWRIRRRPVRWWRGCLPWIGGPLQSDRSRGGDTARRSLKVLKEPAVHAELDEGTLIGSDSHLHLAAEGRRVERTHLEITPRDPDDLTRRWAQERDAKIGHDDHTLRPFRGHRAAVDDVADIELGKQRQGIRGRRLGLVRKLRLVRHDSETSNARSRLPAEDTQPKIAEMLPDMTPPSSEGEGAPRPAVLRPREQGVRLSQHLPTGC